MRWLRICLLSLLQRTTYAMLSMENITWTGAITSKHEDTALPGILSVLGGLQQLKSEVLFIMNNALSTRNRTSTMNAVHLDVGRYAIVSKLCFDDKTCWAVKMYQNRPTSIFDRAIEYGTLAASLVQRHCPYIPINSPQGCGVHKFKYCLTDWVEGETLFDRYFPNTTLRGPSERTITIPQKTVSSLAEFVYNLTTCPIPANEMAKLKRDDLKDFLLAPEGCLVPEAKNAADWAKHQFWTWYLFWPRASIKPYDGLDHLLLMGWVSKWFREPDLPFVLLYWDLRMPNIVVDDDDNLKAIIDWDNVSGIPINLSAVSLGESFSRSDPTYSLNKDNVQYFQSELTRIEQERASSSNFSHMLLHSHEHMFLREILYHGAKLDFLNLRYPELLSAALERSSESIALAASLWMEFSHTFFTSQGLAVPDLPLYVEIQEGLGIYGRNWIERLFIRIKGKLNKGLTALLDNILGRSAATTEEGYRVSIGERSTA